ncbi:MAG: hypothetical protein RMK80_06655 [Pseudobdellovibrionaceae bacterium]|nr:hypothetical protein [Pseudobdellovibrionaceae bacterium]
MVREKEMAQAPKMLYPFQTRVFFIFYMITVILAFWELGVPALWAHQDPSLSPPQPPKGRSRIKCASVFNFNRDSEARVTAINMDDNRGLRDDSFRRLIEQHTYIFYFNMAEPSIVAMKDVLKGMMLPNPPDTWLQKNPKGNWDDTRHAFISGVTTLLSGNILQKTDHDHVYFMIQFIHYYYLRLMAGEPINTFYEIVGIVRAIREKTPHVTPSHAFRVALHKKGILDINAQGGVTVEVLPSEPFEPIPQTQ